MLWFAWKIVLLQYRKQPLSDCATDWRGCDLLEKSYFCSIANNCARLLVHCVRVVICLKNRTFAVSQTTPKLEVNQGCQLWFAWKIVLLQYRKQRTIIVVKKTLVVICLKNRTFAVSQTTGRGCEELFFGCDLLEKSYFCSIANNLPHWTYTHPSVVICLKNRTFAVSQTTQWAYSVSVLWLWFAWKIVLLQYRKQRSTRPFHLGSSCDLLEKSYFCSIANNPFFHTKSNEIVVICLKNRTFAVSQTTVRHNPAGLTMLWFAWKIVLLQYRKQHFKAAFDIAASCDLLEKSYFCSIANNINHGP